MKMKFIITVIVFAVVALLASHGFAEIIYLKDGKVINAKIIERGTHYVITKTGKKMKKYYLSQIDHIEEDEAGDVNDRSLVNLPKYEGIAADKVRLIFNYLDVSGVRTSMKQNINLAIDRAPAEKREKFKELFDVNEIINLIIPIYNKYYSEVDLINMIQFYESPTGVKVIESTPEIMKETVSVSIQYIKENMAP